MSRRPPENDPVPSPLQEGFHEPLRHSPAPVLNTLLRSVDRALHALGLRRFAEGLWLGTARGRWLDEWASLYAFVRLDNETDEALRSRMQRDTVLGRMVTTEAAIISAIFQATGLTVRIRATRLRVAMFDDLDASFPGDHMVDYGVVYKGQELFDEIPDPVNGSNVRLPLRPAWGPDGMIIDIPVFYEAGLERSILQAMLDKVPAMAGFDLAWSKDLRVEWRDELSIDDGGQACWDGWGEDPWDVPFGSICEPLNLRGFGVEPWGKNWGSRPTRRVSS